MNKTLGSLILLKRLLASVSSGRGVSGSIVVAFKGAKRNERSAARMVLLGHPPRTSLASIAPYESREVGMLASLVTLGSGSDVVLLGKKGLELSTILERWLKAREARLMDARVMQMRGFVMSAVLGAVMAIVSALGPIVSTSTLLGPTAPIGPSLDYASGAMVVVSSSMIGLFLSGRRFYLNLALALGVFWLALSAASPLSSIPDARLWGIK